MCNRASAFERTRPVQSSIAWLVQSPNDWLFPLK